MSGAHGAPGGEQNRVQNACTDLILVYEEFFNSWDAMMSAKYMNPSSREIRLSSLIPTASHASFVHAASRMRN